MNQIRIFKLNKGLQIVLTFILCLSVHTITIAESSKLFIEFTDKNNNRYSIHNPSEYLSQRALERRARLGIAIDEQDLPLSDEYVSQVEALGLRVTNKLHWLNGVLVFCDNPEKIERVRNLSFVKQYRRVDNPIKKKTTFNKFPKRASFLNDKAYFENRSIHQDVYPYGYATKQIKMLHGDYLHNKGYDGRGKIIGVIDAGYENANRLPVFDSLFQNEQILGTKDFVEPDKPDSAIYRAHYHGTMVLSVMGGHTRRFVGTAPKASYWLLRSEDADTEKVEEEYFWTDAAEFCDSVGVDVINSSLGYTQFDNPLENHVYQDLDGKTTPCAKAANKAFKSGIAVINSAGNSGAVTNEWHYIGTPADALGALAIGAVDTNGVRAFFSSWGPSPDGRVKPDVTACGYQVRVAFINGDIDFSAGTSFSSPVTAGMVACLWQAKKDLSPQKLYNLIRESGHIYTNPNDSMGYGIPSFSKALDGTNIFTQNNKSFMVTSRGFSVYPKTFSHSLTVSFDTHLQRKVNVAIFSLSGEKIYSHSIEDKNGLSSIAIKNLKEISAGSYILSCRIGENIYSEKIIKYHP